MSSLMTALGLDIGHETMGSDGTSDWRRAPLEPKEFDHVLHVVRDPFMTITSMWLTTAEKSRDFMWDNIRRTYGLPAMDDCLLRTAMSYLLWHKMIAEHDLSLVTCVEDACVTVPDWLYENGHINSPQYHLDANRNARPHRELGKHEWEQLPSSLLDEIKEFGARYNYV